MGITIRYFAPSGAGLADGTSVTDVASLTTSSGTWSSIIRNFPFTSGADSLECRILPGSYLVTQELTTSVFNSGTPTFANMLYFNAAQSNGSLWTPPDPDWTAAQPVWDTGTMPYIEYSGTNRLFNTSNYNLFGLNMNTNSNTSLSAGLIVSANHVNWCYASARTTSGSFALIGANNASNTVGKIQSLTYEGIFSGMVGRYYNCRAEGNPSATTASRDGFTQTSANAPLCIKCVSINNRRHGFNNSNSFNSTRIHMYNCISYGNYGHGFNTQVASATSINSIEDSIFIDNSGYGINITSSGIIFPYSNYFRDNTSGSFFGLSGNYPSGVLSYFSGGPDSSDFVDPTGTFDLRIKYGSPIWGLNIGAGDEPAPSSISSVTTPNRIHPLAYTGRR